MTEISNRDLISTLEALPPAKWILSKALVASAFLKAHEKLILCVLTLALVWGVSGKVQDIILAHDKAKQSKDTVALQKDVAKNDADAKASDTLAKQSAQLAADYKIMLQQVLGSNKQLQNQNQKLTDALKNQQNKDAALPPTALAARIEKLSGAPPNTIEAKPDHTFAVPNADAVLIAQSLENIPVLQTQLANVQLEKTNDDNLLQKQSGVVTGLNNQVTGLQTEIAGLKTTLVAANRKYDDDTKVLKDQVRRSKGKWFIAGYICGLITKPAIKLLNL